MVFFNHATRQMTTKIVYYGPGLCGKTTNLNTIYGRTSQKARGEMVSLNTETDRTLFFDLLPMDVGMVGGFKTKLQLYTVPGQVFYNSTRKLVLKGVDGIVFVADSQTPMLDANKESYQNLRDNLRELGLDLKDIPLVFQWNKRDLKNIVPVETLERELNPTGKGSFQSIASDGTGVFETLRGITKLALAQIKTLHMAESSGPKPPPAPKVGAAALVASEFSMPDDLRDNGVPVEALSTTDLAASKDLFGDEETSGGFVVPPPAPDVAPVSAKPPRKVQASPVAAHSPVPAPPVVHVPPTAHVSAAPSPSHSPAKSGQGQVQVMAPMHVKLSPNKGTAAFPKVNLRPLAAPVPKVAPAPLASGAHMSMPKAPVARSHADLHLMLSPFTQDGELEVVVTVRQNGAVVGEGAVLQAAPGWGASGMITLEIKRG